MAPSPQSEGVRPSAAQALADELEASIREGNLRAGEGLPKIRTLAAERNLSHTTVVQALRGLEARGLIHKRGRSILVGPAPKSRRASPPSSPPTVLLLSQRPEEWPEFHAHFLQPFASRFALEADRFGVRLAPVLAQASGGGGDPLFPAGLGRISEFVRSLGRAYQGTAVLSMRRHFPAHGKCLRWLDSLQRPILWLQDDEPGKAFAPCRNLVRIAYGDWAGPGNPLPADLAVRTLADRGHRILGFACNEPGARDWVEIRLATLRQAMRGLGRDLALHSRLEFSGDLESAACRKRLEALATQSWRVAASLARDLARFRGSFADWSTPADREFLLEAAVLEPVLRKGDVTALIAPNDPQACRQFAALRREGYSIPGDISLLSFDNRPNLRPYPISSIDFGMDELGYRAFHHLFGALPVRVGRKRVLLGRNSVIDHGSIGPAP